MATTRYDWFSALFGFEEGSYNSILEHLDLKDGHLQSRRNRRSYKVGQFSTPSLAELRRRAEEELAEQVISAAGLSGLPKVDNVVGDVADFHAKPQFCHATFQVASQFNCLEFVGPSVTPERGVTGYAGDRTQGPCCSIACGPATVFRNYFVPVTDAAGKVVSHGQRADAQIENLRDLSAALGDPFQVKGGYTLASDPKLRALNAKLSAIPEDEKDKLRGRLRVGVQEDAEVTASHWGRNLLNTPDQVVTQVFGSACSVAYSRNPRELWAPFARLVLEASYEATLLVAALNAARYNGEDGSRSVFLTALGGGVFGNSMGWVEAAAQMAIDRVCVRRGIALQIYLVSYCKPIDERFLSLVSKFRAIQENARVVKLPRIESKAGKFSK